MLRLAVIDETGGAGWSPAIERAVAGYDAAALHVEFSHQPGDAHIVVTLRSYRDEAMPVVTGYTPQPGVGGFAAVYDREGKACNFPPSPLPLNCSGQIARAEIYLNDVIPPGPDLEARRERLVLHELGHALGLIRHDPNLGLAELARRYGWPE